jgi:hypothetical protein
MSIHKTVMRKILVVLGVCAGLGLHAQTKLYAVAGINRSGLAMSAPFATQSAGYAWQAGLSAQFAIEGNGFLYSGLLYETKNISRKYDVCCSFNLDETYHPQYLTMPFGIGMKIPGGRSMQWAFSGGAYIEWATGGSLEGTESNDFPMPVSPPTAFNRKMNFGSSGNDDMTRWNWGLQAASSVSWKKYMLSLSYLHGINNLLQGNLVEKYRSFQLNFGYRVFASLK